MNKYFIINRVGREQTNTSQHTKQNIHNDRNDWIWGFMLAIAAMLAPILFIYIADGDVLRSIQTLTGSCDIALLCMSTVLSILLSDEWQKQKFIHRLLIFYLVIAAMLYSFSAYAEYAGISKRDCAMETVNISISISMAVIIVAGYLFKNKK